MIVLVAIGGLLVTFFGYVLNRDRDMRNNAVSEAEMKVTLAHISRDVDEIKLEVKINKEQITTFSRDLARVEEVTKQTQIRINKLEGKQQNEN